MRGEITSGNTLLAMDVFANPATFADSPADIHLFSSEDIFFKFATPTFQDSFAKLVAAEIYTSIKVLLFIRDPVTVSGKATMLPQETR